MRELVTCGPGKQKGPRWGLLQCAAVGEGSGNGVPGPQCQGHQGCHPPPRADLLPFSPGSCLLYAAPHKQFLAGSEGAQECSQAGEKPAHQSVTGTVSGNRAHQPPAHPPTSWGVWSELFQSPCPPPRSLVLQCDMSPRYG